MATSSMKEIIKRRDMYSKTFKKNGNSFVTEYYSYPVHYLNTDRAWEEINLNIDTTEKWEFTNEVTSNIFRVYFGDKTHYNQHLMSVEYSDNNKDKWINFKLLNASPIGTEIYGNNNEKFKFVECFKDVDLEYIVTENSVKENIILNKNNDLRKFDFSIKFGETDLIENDEDGYCIIDKESQKIIWNIDKPYMIDYNGDITYGVKYEISNLGEYKILSVVIEDEKFLNEATYPIVIDPTVTVDNQSDFIASYRYGGQNKTPETSSYLATSTNFGAYSQNNSDINLNADFFAIYSSYIDQFKNNNNYVVNSLKLNLYCYSSASNFPLYISNLSSSLVAGQRPNTLNDNFAQIIPRTNQWFTVDLTNQFKSRGNNFYGIAVKVGSSNAENQQTRGGFFYSSYNSNTTLRPKLTVEYLIKPTLAFHDGNPDSTGYYSDGEGNVFREFDFGTLIAGQTSTPIQLFVRNVSDFAVNNLNVKVEKELASGGYVELSLTRNPFSPLQYFTIDNTIGSNQDISFYARLRTEDTATAGGTTRLLANAYPS